MSEHKTGLNAAHDATVAAAEGVRQVAIAGATTQAAATAATRTYLAAVIASGKANGISCINQQVALDAINKSGNP